MHHCDRSKTLAKFQGLGVERIIPFFRMEWIEAMSRMLNFGYMVKAEPHVNPGTGRCLGAVAVYVFTEVVVQ